MNYNILRRIVREIIENELDEVTASGAAGPYQTPYAFAGNGEGANKRRKQSATKSGFSIIDHEPNPKADKL